MFIITILTSFLGITAGYRNSLQIGLILRDGDDTGEKIADNIFRRTLSNGPQRANYVLVKETVPYDDAFFYHKAVCRLLKKGVGGILTPITSSNFPILSSYSNEYNLSLVAPTLLETPDDPKTPDLVAKFAVGIRPSTIRVMLDLIRDLRWQEIVYIYDDDYNPEKLQVMFRVGYSALHMKLIGFARVNTAKETITFLQSLDSHGSQRSFQVILDTDIALARDILQLHVHHTGVRKKNYHFIISQPTLESFWTTHEFGALTITGFLTFPPEFNRVKNAEEEWAKLLGQPSPNAEREVEISDYYYHDAALFLAKAVYSLRSGYRNEHDRKYTTLQASTIPPKLTSECFREAPDGRLAKILKKVKVLNGLTGGIEFSETRGSRININLTIVQSKAAGYRELGWWSDMGKTGGIRKSSNPEVLKPDALPQIADRNTLRITTILSPPYLMLKKEENGSQLTGNNRFEGYCKDMVDYICEILKMTCELMLVQDGTYGIFDSKKQRWSGMIGEILQGKADLAVADLRITGKRQRVVEFSDPFDVVSLSVLVKNPEAITSASSIFFIFRAFNTDVWICMIIAAILFCVIFHGITRFTGAPDSIQSASGIWGRKNGVAMNVWFAIGSSMMQGTGVYPRSISSRILAGAWWFTTTVFICLIIACLTVQLGVNNYTNSEKNPRKMQLQSLSLESIILESLTRGWPKIGVIQTSNTINFIKNSNLRVYSKFDRYFEDNPELKVANIQEGIKRIRESDGDYILLMDSTASDYAIRQQPCDLLATHDSFAFAGYGIAMSPLLGSILSKNITELLTKMQNDGMLGHLHRKWWIESSQCKKQFVPKVSVGVLHSVSGFLCILLGFFLVFLVVFGIQFSRRIRDKESKRKQLTFNDIDLDDRLPTPPPEMLVQQPPIGTMTHL